MFMAVQTNSLAERVAFKQIPAAGALAGVLAAVVNSVIWFVAGLAGTVTVPLVPVLVSSIVGMAVSVVVYALIGRFTKRPITIFTIVAIVFLVFSFVLPVNAMQSAPPGMEKFNLTTVIAAELMHVVTGVLAIWSYTKRARIAHVRQRAARHQQPRRSEP